MTATRHQVDTAAGPAWIDVEQPRAPVGVCLLGHGAGGGVDAPDLCAAREGALSRRFTVARVTQPYRVAGRRTPPTAAVLDDAWLVCVAAVRQLRGMRRLPVVVGGRSSGARVACRTASAADAAAVVALAFPLHPPGRPDRSRLDELRRPAVPVLLVQGDRDAFGMPGEDAVTRRVVIEGADHSLRKGTAAVRDAVAAFLTAAVAD